MFWLIVLLQDSFLEFFGLIKVHILTQTLWGMQIFALNWILNLFIKYYEINTLSPLLFARIKIAKYNIQGQISELTKSIAKRNQFSQNSLAVMQKNWGKK